MDTERPYDLESSPTRGFKGTFNSIESLIEFFSLSQREKTCKTATASKVLEKAWQVGLACSVSEDILQHKLNALYSLLVKLSIDARIPLLVAPAEGIFIADFKLDPNSGYLRIAFKEPGERTDLSAYSNCIVIKRHSVKIACKTSPSCAFEKEDSLKDTY